jgi:hypothetical protein
VREFDELGERVDVGNVFIAHAAGDARFASNLAKSLRAMGVLSHADADVRRLEDEPHAVSALADALRAAGYVVVIISEKSVGSPNLNFEVGAAIGQDKPVIPVLLSRSAGRRFRAKWLRDFLDDSVVAEEKPVSVVARSIAQRMARERPRELITGTTSRRTPVSGRKRYHVTHDDLGWKIQREGASRASARAATLEEAERRAKQIASRSGGGEVVTHGRDGKVRESDTIPPSK